MFNLLFSAIYFLVSDNIKIVARNIFCHDRKNEQRNLFAGDVQYEVQLLPSDSEPQLNEDSRTVHFSEVKIKCPARMAFGGTK